MNHAEWVANEYKQWISALKECTVHNFKEHPMVRRMLSLDMPLQPWKDRLWGNAGDVTSVCWRDIETIDNIGWNGSDNKGIYRRPISGMGYRMFYYALEVLHRNPSSICEIGGGVGQFYATLRAMGYTGGYYIYDLHEVKAFQFDYLAEVALQTGLNTLQVLKKPEMVVSFYAYGEFSDRDKKTYWDHVIRDCSRGYIAWNPHSGASRDYSFITHPITVTPGIEPGITIIEW